MDVIKQSMELEKEYLNKFGEHSLDRVIYCDPLNMTTEEMEQANNVLRNAIKNNEPLEQIPKEEWDNIIF